MPYPGLSSQKAAELLEKFGKKGFAPLILVIVIGIVLAAGGLGLGLAWKAGFFGKPGGPQDGTTTNGTQPPPSDGEEDPTKDWRTYSGSEYSIKYPANWYVDAEGETLWIGSYDFSELQQVPAGEVLVWLNINNLAEPLNGRDFRAYLKDQYPASEGYIVEEETISLGPWDWIVINNGYGSMQTLIQDKVLGVTVQGSIREEAPSRWETLDLIFSTLSLNG